MLTAVTLAVVSDPFSVPVPHDVPRYYRARALAGEVLRPGPWSNTLVSEPAALTQYRLRRAEDYDPSGLLAFQQSLLRYCAGRADLFAVLSLPRHFTTDDARRHAAALGGGADASDRLERTLSFGALYHPWMLTPADQSREEELLTPLPPDAAVVGALAALAAGEGAWIPPANLPLTGPLALVPTIDAAAERRLSEVRVNPLCQRPRGFLICGLATLSGQGDVTDIQVRRLLILLRRLALREGNLYVFEPNDGSLRGRVRLIFERMLQDLYHRGAFGGLSAEDAFRVAVDDSVNPPGTTETGRLVVELRVLPARAAEQIRVRLIQDGPEQLVLEEG
jgi:phage tail sheath protein FI